jgi:anhydro-N-acetylmuramic acid kinase
MKVLGLMSGTSADGIDAVLVEFGGRPARPRWRILASCAHPYPAPLRAQLVELGQGKACTAAQLLDLAEAVTEAQALAARACDPRSEAVLVGCHGQTVWHRPPAGGQRGASWQLLQGPLLAGLLERPVVFDFRSADLALGGEGAPLVPATDEALLGRTGGWRAVLNLGGIANLTLLPPACGPERHRPVLGWDCGPANTLIDLAVERFSEGRQRYDAAGSWNRTFSSSRPSPRGESCLAPPTWSAGSPSCPPSPPTPSPPSALSRRRLWPGTWCEDRDRWNYSWPEVGPATAS